jgi:hypothetical protein
MSNIKRKVVVIHPVMFTTVPRSDQYLRTSPITHVQSGCCRPKFSSIIVWLERTRGPGFPQLFQFLRREALLGMSRLKRPNDCLFKVKDSVKDAV